MTNQNRSAREQELIASLLNNRHNLRTAYCAATGDQPPRWLTDAEMVRSILHHEYPEVAPSKRSGLSID